MASKSSRLAMMTALARIVSANIASEIPTRTYGRLKQSIRYIVTSDRVIVYSTYYWARWVNDGRGPIEADPGKFLIFFEDPKDDPRIKAGYPRKPEQVKRLTRRQLRKAREEGQLIETESVGPAEGLKFLERGIQKSRLEVPPKLQELVQGDVRRLIRRSRNKITVRL
jgi:hypothetical protein